MPARAGRDRRRDQEGDALGGDGRPRPGAVELAEGDAARRTAARCAAPAGDGSELEAPYEAARARELLGPGLPGTRRRGGRGAGAGGCPRSLRASSARRPTWRGPRRSTSPAPGAPSGLTARELEVLRLVAAGESNREIAAALVISEHTVARHLQNIFAKLGVSSRTAAGAFAFEHDLV